MGPVDLFQTPLSLNEARAVVRQFVSYYNNERLRSAIGYITPSDKLLGKADAIFAERQRKMRQARDNRARYWSEESLNVENISVTDSNGLFV